MSRPNAQLSAFAKWGLLAPASALIALGIVLPLVAGFLAAFQRDGRWSLENYRIVLTELPYVPIMLNTLFVSITVCVFSVGLAFAVCMKFARSGPVVTRLFLGSMTLILAISLLVKNYAIQVILAYNGPLNAFAVTTGVFDQRQYLLYTKPAVIVAMIQFLSPYAALILFGAIRRIDFDIVLAARTLGAGPVTVFRTAIWPQINTSVLMVSVLMFSIAAGFFVTPALLGGPHETMIGSKMYSDLLYNRTYGSGLATAQGMVLTAILAAISLVAFWFAGAGFLSAGDSKD